MLTLDYCFECFDYNKDTGSLVWRERPIGHFKNEGRWTFFTRRDAGKEAGSLHICANTNYRIVMVGGEYVLAHRIIWFMEHGEWPDKIDHINGNGLDNRLENLRNVSSLGNNRNRRRKYPGPYVMGVRKSANKKRWQARIKINEKYRHLGVYDDWFDAVCARKSAESRHGFHPNHGRAAA